MMLVRLVPGPPLAALKAHLDKELAVWYCLRSINHWGNGHLDLQMAIETLVVHFHYSKSITCRILSSGDGIFWEKRSISGINRLQIEIYGLKNIAR